MTQMMRLEGHVFTRAVIKILNDLKKKRRKRKKNKKSQQGNENYKGKSRDKYNIKN